MTLFFKRRSKKVGLPPGTLVFLGERKVEELKITVINYDETQYSEKEVKNVEECFPYKEDPRITWINVDGVHQVEIIDKLGEHFVLHPLLLEDVVNTGQRPKIEEYEDHLFIVLKMFNFDQANDEITVEQVSLILGANFVITFQEKEGDVFNPIRERLKKARGRIRGKGADYLAYALIDAIVDSYFTILEEFGGNIESLQEELITAPRMENLQVLQRLKRDMLSFRKSVWPLREVINGLVKGEPKLIKEDINLYLRDVYDHTIQVMDTIESFREMLSAMLDIYLSSVGNKMNEVMKVLTIIATIFIPMTFMAGVYGMNFKYMPELAWRWSYPLFWLLIIIILLIMIALFRRRKWL